MLIFIKLLQIIAIVGFVIVLFKFPKQTGKVFVVAIASIAIYLILFGAPESVRPSFGTSLKIFFWDAPKTFFKMITFQGIF